MSAAQAPEISGNWRRLVSDQRCSRRTACINCRSRKKLCYMNKPECDNCVQLGLQCQYGPRPPGYEIKLKFISRGHLGLGVEEKRRREDLMDHWPQSKRIKLSPIPTPESVTQDIQTLQSNFDVSATDMSAAYGGVQQVAQQDSINDGMHDTHRAGRYLALDCEMVGTGPPPHSDDLLARVSIVNYHGQQIYDSYVLPVPGCRVQDYRTHVSGIRPEHLRPGIARPFADVRSDIRDLLTGTILVGHALRKDLQALQLDHPKRDIRDTSRHAAYRIESRGKTPALRNLARSQLGLTIQIGEHSSIEDARTAMLLFKKEKSAFESENRKQYGTRKVVKPQTARSEEKEDNSDDDDGRGIEYDSDDDEALLEQDENTLLQDGNQPAKATSSKKKKKKKKRTKR